MKEITSLICYQPEVPSAHKAALIDALVAFQKEIPEASSLRDPWPEDGSPAL
jgi:hypothetical protein